MHLFKCVFMLIFSQYGTTPLIWACRKGYIEIVDALLAEGANADASGMVCWGIVLFLIQLLACPCVVGCWCDWR